MAYGFTATRQEGLSRADGKNSNIQEVYTHPCFRQGDVQSLVGVRLVRSPAAAAAAGTTVAPSPPPTLPAGANGEDRPRQRDAGQNAGAKRRVSSKKRRRAPSPLRPRKHKGGRTPWLPPPSCVACGGETPPRASCTACCGEYHSRCLDPPLAVLPGSGWVCSFCRPPQGVHAERRYRPRLGTTTVMGSTRCFTSASLVTSVLERLSAIPNYGDQRRPPMYPVVPAIVNTRDGGGVGNLQDQALAWAFERARQPRDRVRAQKLVEVTHEGGGGKQTGVVQRPSGDTSGTEQRECDSFSPRKGVPIARGGGNDGMRKAFAHETCGISASGSLSAIKEVEVETEGDDDGAFTAVVHSAGRVVSSSTCLVCEEGGILVKCAECEFAFHLDCVDPPLERLPGDGWECGMCVESSSCSPTPRKSSSKRPASETSARAIYVTNNGPSCSKCDRRTGIVQCCKSCEAPFHLPCMDPPSRRRHIDGYTCVDCWSKISDPARGTRKPAQQLRKSKVQCSSCSVEVGQVVLCVGCDSAFHAGCMDPPRKAIPKHAYACRACRERESDLASPRERARRKSTKENEIPHSPSIPEPAVLPAPQALVSSVRSDTDGLPNHAANYLTEVEGDGARGVAAEQRTGTILCAAGEACAGAGGKLNVCGECGQSYHSLCLSRPRIRVAGDFWRCDACREDGLR